MGMAVVNLDPIEAISRAHRQLTQDQAMLFHKIPQVGSVLDMTDRLDKLRQWSSLTDSSERHFKIVPLIWYRRRSAHTGSKAHWTRMF